MKLWNRNICVTNKGIYIGIFIVAFSTFVVIANAWGRPIVKETEVKEVEMWIPTMEDILYQDSMYSIIESTQNDITDIKEDIVHILERLEYQDGSYDSIRYVKDGAIDRKRNKHD